MISDTTRRKFFKILEVVKADLATLRTGKATPTLVENVVVDAYGTKMRLMELSTITASDVTTLLITPFDVSNLGLTSKAITDANLGLTAIVEENHVRVIVPPLSQERRMEYVKLAKTKVEGGKVMCRQVRHEAMNDVSKMEIDEDSKKRLEEEIQTLTDDTVAALELMEKEKEKELMQI
jgi:ribosome recycling factor